MTNGVDAAVVLAALNNAPPKACVITSRRWTLEVTFVLELR